MFTIFHTADWHLGQSFHGYDRHEEHAKFLKWLIEQLQQQQPDALIIAGDIFDTINPSAQATKLYYTFLADLRTRLPLLHIVITAGNHDSGSRLEAPADLLASLQIAVVGTIQKDEFGTIDLDRLLVPLKSITGELQAIVIAMPFLRPSDVPRIEGADDAYLDGIRHLYEQAYQRALDKFDCEKIPVISIGHCHMQGGSETPDSERRIVIGGSEALSTDAFPADSSYVALGHLHKAQKFQSGRICYSGSPIPLSFTERIYQHRILKVSFEQSQRAEVSDVMIPTAVPLLTIPSKPVPLPEVLEQLKQLPDSPSSENDPEETDNQADFKEPPAPAFLEVRILNDGPDPSRSQKIEEALANKHVRLASMKLIHPERESTDDQPPSMLTVDELQTVDAEQIFRSAYTEKYANDPDDSVVEAFREIVAAVQENQ